MAETDYNALALDLVKAYRRYRAASEESRDAAWAAYRQAAESIGMGKQQDDFRLAVIGRIRQTDPHDFLPLGLDPVVAFLVDLEDARGQGGGV
jgi:hypothetical protein